MKRVINGHMYDSENAKKLGEGGWGAMNDLAYYSEVLYRTKAGNYFLRGVGGPNSKYAASGYAGRWGGGEKIIPLTEENARAWAEEHLEGGEYEKAFGPVEDDSVLLTIQTRADVKEAFDARKKAECKTANELLEDLLK